MSKQGQRFKLQSGEIVEPTGTYDVVAIKMEDGSRGYVTRIGVRSVDDPAVVRYLERRFLLPVELPR